MELQIFVTKEGYSAVTHDSGVDTYLIKGKKAQVHGPHNVTFSGKE